MAMMIRHIVILHFDKKHNTDYYSLLLKTKPIINKIPAVISYNIYRNQSHYTPKNIISLGVEIVFKDQESLDAFMNDPKHYEANKLFEEYLATPGYMVLTHEIQAASASSTST